MALVSVKVSSDLKAFFFKENPIIFIDLPANQRIQLENIMKKVMGVAYMPEELTGQLW